MAWCFCIYESPKYLMIRIEELEKIDRKQKDVSKEIERLTDQLHKMIGRIYEDAESVQQ